MPTPPKILLRSEGCPLPAVRRSAGSSRSFVPAAAYQHHRPMTSVAFLTEDDERSALQAAGFFYEKDSRLGALVAETGKGLTLLSEDGLEFYRANVLNNGVGTNTSSFRPSLTINSAYDRFSLPSLPAAASAD